MRVDECEYELQMGDDLCVLLTLNAFDSAG